MKQACQRLIICTLTFASAAHSNTTFTSSCIDHENLDRPSIGLVLGGGGARGAAHIGVIRKLEELNIPVDYVAGTSMGALVGALYATGMNADELEQTINSLEWSDLFNDNTARADRPFRRKRDDDLALWGPKLGVGKDSSLLPRGAISGQKISFLFESLVQDRVQVDVFDDLPIPFRAVAADIATGKAIVLGSGDLALAMRSSISVPGLFDPVEHEGNLLVDGGIANNVPVDVVRAMGADRVIAIDVGSPLIARDKLDNPVSVLTQMSGLLIQHNVEAQIATLGGADLLLRPDIGTKVLSVDFAKSAEAIEIGYAVANDHQNALKNFSISTAAHQAHRRAVESCGSPSESIQFVRLDNRSRFSDALLRERLRQPVGQPLNSEMLKQDIEQIYALGFLELVRYEVVTENGQSGLVVHVIQDQRGTSLVEWGVDLEGDNDDNEFAVRLGYLKTDLDQLGSELRILTQLGDDPGIMAEVYKPLNTRQKWVFRPKLFASRSDLTDYNEDGDAIRAFEIDEIGGSVILVRELNRHAAIVAGVNRVTGEVDVTIGSTGALLSEFDDGGYTVGFQWDRLDDLYFPNSGVFMDASYYSAQDSLGADFEFEQFNITAGVSRTFGRHNILGLTRYATTFDDDAPLYALFRGGGFTNLSGFNDQELAGQHFGMGLLGYRLEMSKRSILPAYVGATLEYGNAGNDRDDLFDEGVFNGSMYLGFRSPLGPLYIGYGYAEGGRNRYFLRVGNVFGRADISER